MLLELEYTCLVGTSFLLKQFGFIICRNHKMMSVTPKLNFNLQFYMDNSCSRKHFKKNSFVQKKIVDKV